MRRPLIVLVVFAAVLMAAFAFLPSREMFVTYFVSAPQATVLFGGDMMFDRSMRQYAAQYGADYLFSCIDNALRDADLVVANLEGPITAEPSVSIGSTPGGAGNYTFTFPPETAALLKRHGIGTVSLGNNHIYNFEAAGVRSTIAALDGAGVGYFGDPLENAVADVDHGGVRFAFINYNEFLPPAVGTASTTLAQIAAAKQEGRLPVVYAHWGVEYAPKSTESATELAHEFIDAGAVAVIGSHPHVVQNNEVYKGAPIYYSLGNFIFDQYFSAAVTHGLLLKLTFSSAGVTAAQELPIVLSNDRRVCLQ